MCIRDRDNIYGLLTDADMKFPDCTDGEGNKHPLSHGTYISYMESGDRALRKSAFENLYHTYGCLLYTSQRSLAQLFGARSKPANAACAVEQTEFAVDVKMYECHEAAFLSRKSAAVTPGLLRSSPCPLPPEPAACACGG